jgi:hypothetical protein
MTQSLSVSYGGKGPLILGVTWAEMSLAFILFILRAKTASVYPQGQLSSGIFGLRWDFVWVILAFVRGSSLYPASQGGTDSIRLSPWQPR